MSTRLLGSATICESCSGSIGKRIGTILVIGSAAFWLLAEGSGECRAELHHAMAGYYTSVSGMPGLTRSGLDFDNGFASNAFPNTIFSQPEIQSLERFETFAHALNFAPSILAVSAYAGLQRPSGITLDTIAYSVAGWSDAFEVSGIAPPTTVRLNFELTGTLAAISAYSNAAIAFHGYGSHNFVQDVTSPLDPASGDPRNIMFDSGPFEKFSGGLSAFGQTIGSLSGQGWDAGSSATIVPSTLNGNPGATDALLHLYTHIDVRQDANGVYPFQFFLMALAEETLWGDNTYADAGHTLSLVSLTLPDGTPLSSLGATTIFDSGMTFPVPESSSFILAALGLISLAVGRRKIST